MVRFLSFRLNDDRGALTLSPGILPIVEAISSAMPSLRASLLESRPMFLKASTAMDDAALPATIPVSAGARNASNDMNPAAMAAMVAGTAQSARILREAGGASAFEQASLNAPALGKRSAAVFASAFLMARSMLSGASGRLVRSGGTGSSECLARISRAVVPMNGGWPLSISYNTQPSA